MPLFNQPPQTSPEVPSVDTTNKAPVTKATKTITAESLIQWSAIKKEPEDASSNPYIKNNQVAIAQEMRFLDVKYKVYTVIIGIILILMYVGIFTEQWIVSGALQETRAKRQSLGTIDTTISDTISRQEQYKQEQNLFKEITNNKSILITCINKQSSCDQLPNAITTNLDAVRAYLQLGNLQRSKMEVDESKILKNINEFITQKNILDTKRDYNGIVSSITIDNPEDLENNIMKVPVELTITFNSKQDLLTFLSNIENYVFAEWDDLSSSVLFRIEELKYDIVNYKESQDVQVSLSAYAYRWE
jgi:hypothetical protein